MTISKHAAANKLCMSCGICCQGLLHARAALRAEEVGLADRHGLEIEQGKELAFRIPCSKFDGRCTIYGDRPHTCAAFRCALLRRLEDGEVSLGEGFRIVAEAQRLKREAEETVPSAELVSRFRSLVYRSGQSVPAPERLRLTALALYLDKHFVLSRDGYFYSASPIETMEDR